MGHQTESFLRDEPADLGNSLLPGTCLTLHIAAPEQMQHHRGWRELRVDADQFPNLDRTVGLLLHLPPERAEKILPLFNLSTGHLPPPARDSHEQDLPLGIRYEAGNSVDVRGVMGHRVILRIRHPRGGVQSGRRQVERRVASL